MRRVDVTRRPEILVNSRLSRKFRLFGVQCDLVEVREGRVIDLRERGDRCMVKGREGKGRCKEDIQ